jgi:hypothetical protein
MNALEVIKRIVTLGDYENITGRNDIKNIDEYVTAGNPGKPSDEYPPLTVIPDNFIMNGQSYHVCDYNLYTVLGHSMEPDGILNGYRLIARAINAKEIKIGDFIIIDVDDEFYKKRHNGVLPIFHKKLRRAVGVVLNNMLIKDLLNMLTNTFAEPFTKWEKMDLDESWKEAKKFYGDMDLFLSVTYHKSKIHYSFHPQANIHYRVDGVAYIENGIIEAKGIEELAS